MNLTNLPIPGIAQAKIAGVVVLALALFGSGWTVRAWFDGSKEAVRLQAEAANRELMTELANKVSSTTETAIQGIRIENRTIYNETQKEVVRDVVYRDCVLPADGVRRANQARGRAAAGKPDGALQRPGTSP